MAAAYYKTSTFINFYFSICLHDITVTMSRQNLIMFTMFLLTNIINFQMSEPTQVSSPQTNVDITVHISLWTVTSIYHYFHK